MKNFKVLIALALLAVAGTGLAVTCSQDNVPGATLLVPFFKVSRNGSTGGDIVGGGTDTLVAITNVSSAGVIAHATVWSKYSVAVLDFNIPLTSFDVASFSVRDVLNGKLNVNPAQQNGTKGNVCLPTVTAIGGFGKTTFQRFTNPSSTDRTQTTAYYAVPAFSGAFRTNVWGALDESADVTSITTPNYDRDGAGCAAPNPALAGDFSGYITIDVANYCTNFFPNQPNYYVNDAIATNGWTAANGGPGSPNVLMGDVIFLDPSENGGNISGDQAVSLEYDSRLVWYNGVSGSKTFYTRYYDSTDTSATPATVPAAYVFAGDGREPLAGRFGVRYISDAAGTTGYRTWAVIWRSDVYLTAADTTTTLCGWWANEAGGYTADATGVNLTVYDTDETPVTSTVVGGPSGYVPPSVGKFIFLETQRYLVSGPGSDTNLVPAGSWANGGGWIDVNFKVAGYHTMYQQAFVGVQHGANGKAVSVGHSATILDNQFLCIPAANVFVEAGNVAQ